MQEQTQYQDIVLIGGGHSHTILLHQWAENPLPGARLTLISPQIQSTCSDMLPGIIAGHYSYSDVQIDLPRLCRAAGARFIHACAHQIDLAQRRISLLGRPDLEFDLLSLNTGTAPSSSITGSELAIPTTPAAHFYRYWQQLKQRILTDHQPFKLGVVGGGAGGCELAMAMAWALEEQLYSARVEIHLIQAGSKVPPEYPLLSRRLLARELHRLKVQVHRNWRVAEITHRGVHSDEGQFLPLDKVLLCTEASAPPWLAESGLSLNDSGFVLADEFLRASGQPHIFASGDMVTIEPVSATKSSASARQQGALLYENLRATLLGRPLRPFRERRAKFSLLACGNQRAIASRSGIAAVGGLLWHWKDRADRKLLQRLNNPPAAQKSRPSPNPEHSLHSPVPLPTRSSGNQPPAINPPFSEQQSASPNHGVATIKIPAGKLLVQHARQLRAPIADPWLCGRLGALHTLSEIFALHAHPVSAQALITLPNASSEAARRDLQQLLAGVQRELEPYKCALNDGQVSQGDELQLGLSINGLLDGQYPQGNTGIRAGDCLILSKPLGTGTLLTAETLGCARARWLQQGLDVMLQSNAGAAEIFAAHNASALTTVGQLGLLGHLLDLLRWRSSKRGEYTGRASQPGATLFTDALPLLPGASTCAQRGIFSDLYHNNRSAFDALQNPGMWQADPRLSLLADPQICGGLLAAVPAERADACLGALHAAGARHGTVIGFVDELPASREQFSCTPQPVRLAKNGDWRQMTARYTEMIS